MLDFQLSYFYAGVCIAYHEYFSASLNDTDSFVQRIAAISNEYPDRASLVKTARDLTGVNTARYDAPGSLPSPGQQRPGIANPLERIGQP